MNEHIYVFSLVDSVFEIRVDESGNYFFINDTLENKTLCRMIHDSEIGIVPTTERNVNQPTILNIVDKTMGDYYLVVVLVNNGKMDFGISSDQYKAFSEVKRDIEPEVIKLLSTMVPEDLL